MSPGGAGFSLGPAGQQRAACEAAAGEHGCRQPQCVPWQEQATGGPCGQTGWRVDTLGKGATQLMIVSRGGLDNDNGSSCRCFLRLSKAGQGELIWAQFSFYPSYIWNEINNRDGRGTISLLPRWGELISSSCAPLHASPTALAHGEKHQKKHPFYHTWLFLQWP